MTQRSKCRASFNEEKKVIVLHCLQDRWARGLTKSLSATFSEEFSISAALKSIPYVKQKKHGRQHGNYVDQVLSKWANTGTKPKQCADKTFNYIVALLAQRGWVPVDGQLTLGCHKLLLGTRADLICEDEDGNLVIVELKCGMDDYFDVHNQGTMSGELHHIPISFRYKACLQLLVTTWLFFHNQHAWSGRKVSGAYVMHIYEDYQDQIRDEVFPLPFWMLQDKNFLKTVLQGLKATKAQTQSQRLQRIRNGSKRALYHYKKAHPAKRRKIRI